jgi:hypothetical protein
MLARSEGCGVHKSRTIASTHRCICIHPCWVIMPLSYALADVFCHCHSSLCGNCCYMVSVVIAIAACVGSVVFV